MESMPNSGITTERDEFINAFVAKTVQAASVLFDQYKSANKQQTPASKSASLPLVQESIAQYLATPSGTPMITPLSLPPASIPYPFNLSSSAFAYQSHDPQLSSLYSSPIALAPLTNPPVQMNFEEAEAILSSPLCSPMLGPSANSSPYIQQRRRMSSFNLQSSLSRRSSISAVPPLRRASILSTASTALPFIANSETRDMSTLSSLGCESGISMFQQVASTNPLAFQPTATAPPPSFIKSCDSIPSTPLQSHCTSSSSTDSNSINNSIEFDIAAPISPTLLQSLRESAPPIETKKRTKLTSIQRDYMMSVFKKDQNPSSKVLRVVAENVGMDFRLVQYWFQNRRAALRRRTRRSQFSDEEL
ncbi:hypothetical protein BDR26DRAFT_850705 [Obelidium mucronatum]|nr:hypothetical protein BDR26DRAFT_850705 [Obelidium mucronatum]